MKRLTTILLAMLVASAMHAQRGLGVQKLFAGGIVPGSELSTTEIRGNRLSSYGLTYYHSVSLHASGAQLPELAAPILEDATGADDRETEFTSGLLTYALIHWRTGKDGHRYLCYQAREDGELWRVTVLYLEGSAAPEDLRNIFEKQ